jgi:hypothetical protein
MPRVTIALSAVFAVALGIGVWQFPRSLDPRGAAAHSVTLNDLVTSTASTANDWFVVASNARVSTTSRGLRLRAPRGPRVLELASTPIPVFAQSCYRLDVRASVQRIGTTGAVFDENWTRELRSFNLPRGRPSAVVHATFRTGGRHRVAILFYGTARGSAIIQRVAVVHLADSKCG